MVFVLKFFMQTLGRFRDLIDGKVFFHIPF